MDSKPTKKDKGAAAPEARVCAHCLAPEGQHGVALKACTRCKATQYCGRACQTAHWRAGHSTQCVTPEERVPQDSQEALAARSRMLDDMASAKKKECVICLDAPPTIKLSCGPLFSTLSLDLLEKALETSNHVPWNVLMRF